MHVCLFAFLIIPDSWWPNSDSLSLLIQSYIPTCILVCLCMYIFVLFCFVLVSIPYSWLPNSLFLLDTGSLVWTATSCRPCHPAFLLGFFCLGKCACFSWLSTEILCWSAGIDFPSLLDIYVPVFLVELVCVREDVFCVTVVTGREWMSFNSHLKKISVVHSDRTNRSYLNPAPADKQTQ